MPKYAIDEVNSDRVSGWCYEPGRPTSVLVMVDGRQVGQAVGGLFRVDVAQSIGEEAAITSGFDFRFRPEHFRHVNGNRAGSASSWVMLGRLPCSCRCLFKQQHPPIRVLCLRQSFDC